MIKGKESLLPSGKGDNNYTRERDQIQERRKKKKKLIAHVLEEKKTLLKKRSATKRAGKNHQKALSTEKRKSRKTAKSTR